jgi:hypothetical protein
MKNLYYFKKCFIFTWCVCAAFCSCSTMELQNKSDGEKPKSVNTQKSLNTAEVKVVSACLSTETDDTTKLTSQTAEKQFKEKIEGIDFSIKSMPKQTIKNTAFASAYIVEVTDKTKKTVPNFSVTISCPTSRTNDSIVYETKTACTDTDGLIFFMPEISKFSFDDKITFYPTPISSDPSIMQTAYAAGITAPYKVLTDYVRKPGVIYVFDFNENDTPGTNSQSLLRELINAGVRVGNSPIPSSNYLYQSIESLYKATYKIVGKAYSFMICGSVKYIGPVRVQDDGKYTCQLVADIQCIDMSNGSVIYTTQQTETATAESKYKVLDICRNLLAAKTAHAILYGM